VFEFNIIIIVNCYSIRKNDFIDGKLTEKVSTFSIAVRHAFLPIRIWMCVCAVTKS